MKVDTHVHLLPSKTAQPDWGEIAFTLRFARLSGLDAICVTEHRDAVHWRDLMTGLFIERRLGGEIVAGSVLRLQNGLLVSAGAEVALKGGGDIGVHSSYDALVSISGEKGAHTLADLASLIKTQHPDSTLVAHHVLWKNKWIDGLESKLDSIDAMEHPAKDNAKVDQYCRLSAKLGKPSTSGSDAHTWIQLGAGYTELDIMPAQFSARSFNAALADGRSQAVISPFSAELVRRSGIYRDALEQQNSL